MMAVSYLGKKRPMTQRVGRRRRRRSCA